MLDYYYAGDNLVNMHLYIHIKENLQPTYNQSEVAHIYRTG